MSAQHDDKSGEQTFADRLRAKLKERSKGETETWGFVAAFMDMIDEVEREAPPSHVATSLSDMLQKSYDQGCKDMAMPLTAGEVDEAYGLFTNLMQSGRDRKEVIRILIERSIEARASQPGRDGKAELGSPSRPVASALSATATPVNYTPFAYEEVHKFYEEWPGGLDEVESALHGHRALILEMAALLPADSPFLLKHREWLDAISARTTDGKATPK